MKSARRCRPGRTLFNRFRPARRRRTSSNSRKCDDAMTPRKKVLDQDKKNVPDQGDVEAAMRALPLWLPRDVCDGYIPALAEKYVYMGFDRLRARKPHTKGEVESRLSRIKAQSDELLMSLMQLQEPETEALNSCRSTIMWPSISREHWAGRRAPTAPTLGELQESLQWLSKAASLARPPSTAKSHKGRDRKSATLEVAKAAACNFHSLTGKAPSRSKISRFPGFLGDIFKALDMRHDSVERFAKDAVDWWKNDRLHESDQALRKLIGRIGIEPGAYSS